MVLQVTGVADIPMALNNPFLLYRIWHEFDKWHLNIRSSIQNKKRPELLLSMHGKPVDINNLMGSFVTLLISVARLTSIHHSGLEPIAVDSVYLCVCLQQET